MWSDPYNSSQMLINPSGWRTKSPDPKSLKETDFREWLNKNSHPKLPVSGKNKEERLWRAVKHQFHHNAKDFDPCTPFITLKTSWYLLKCHEGKEGTGMKSGLHGIRHHINIQEGGKVFNITGNFRAGYGTRKVRQDWPWQRASAASPLLCSKLPEHETSPFHLRGANHSLPKTNQPLTFPVF